MLVLLPPSETKATGGDGAPLDLEALSFPELNPIRRKLADQLVELAADVPASLSVLGLSERQADEARRNAQLWDSPTLPALRRYTGVLYDALDIGAMSKSQRGRAQSRLAIASALFGAARGADPIPGYRLSGGCSLPALGPLSQLWRPALEAVLAAADDLILDLRSGAYVNLAPLPQAVAVRVVSEDRTGRRITVSHHNKAYKGRLARALAISPREPTSLRGVRGAASRAGLRLEQTGPRGLDLIAD